MIKKILMSWNNFFSSLSNKPSLWDAFVLSFFVILVTWHPFYLHGRINIFENGLYLPGIDAILRGQVPYRDFFYLRGPFEIYVPAGLMAIFGTHLGVLSTYFYVGTVLTLILCVFLAKELYATRLFLYVAVPVLAARTFPRVVFTYWGGMRFVLGLLAVWCAVKFFKSQKLRWLFFAGCVTSCALLTSVDIGVCAAAGVMAALLLSLIFRPREQRSALKPLAIFILGILFVAIPCGVYLIAAGSFFNYVDTTLTVVSGIPKILNPELLPVAPRNFTEVFWAMVNPSNKNFRHMTPVYFYLLIIIYMIFQIKNRKLTSKSLIIACLAVYGIVLYKSSFYAIWGSKFEMALQPEKILLFFIFERIYFLLKERKQVAVPGSAFLKAPQADAGRLRTRLVNTALVFFIIFSLGYSINHYTKRFFVFRWIKNVLSHKDTSGLLPFKKDDARPLRIERAKGIIVPVLQADELEAVVDFIQKNTGNSEVVFMYQELGAYSFFVDRPFLGRFPGADFSWYKEKWHKEFIADFKRVKPKYIVISREIPLSWKEIFFTLSENKKKFDEVMDIIKSDYALVHTTPLSYIYEIRKPR
ncbi:MAG TPA: hypothetical protein PL155_05160 [Candidatus Omnitrophota bacterium]|nr:hypothetical protein [Candidatus Omnitrophota bacterium]HPD84131.1 hypothetical protein [Candidatus Omnitrophota bacterium]HRZ02988.1 hypothetical protein [Candidatus Omnitrophota bacterium]